MRLLYIKKHKLKRKYYFAGIVMKHGLLVLSLLLCFLVGGCKAIREASGSSRQNKTKNEKNTLSASDQVAPVKGKVISPFGYRGGHNHTGADIKLQKGDTVRAAFGGVVTKAAPYSGYGNLVILKHPNNIETYYSHLSKCLVHEGDSVAASDVVGLGGRTGRATTDHLHFEVRFNHVPKNPENFFDFSNGATKILFLAYAAPVIRIKSEPTPEVCSSDHIVSVQKGDTLYALAKRYGTTVKQIQEINNLESSSLKIGMKLKIK